MTRAAPLSVLIAIVVSGCGTLGQSSPENRDYLLGWYKLENRDNIIPVFKIEGDYYTVIGPGWEIPLKPCPQGLVLSSDGTTIIYDKQASNPYCVSIYDDETAHHTNQEWGTRKKRQLTKIDKPSWLPDPKARRPHGIDDFLGCYLSAWCPGARFEIQNDGEKYIMAMFAYRAESGRWEPAGHPSEMALVPLSGRLGFAVSDSSADVNANVTYNIARKRYEVTAKAEDGSSTSMCLPLARVEAERIAPSGATLVPRMHIGIPSGH